MSDEVLAVFEYWKSTMNYGRAKLDQKRSKKIQERLKDGYTLDDIKEAIMGCKCSRFHQGDNDRGTKFDDICLICRDAEHVDRFIALAENSRKPTTNWIDLVDNRHAH